MGRMGKMNTTGECCIAAKRYILDDKVADTFMARFTEGSKEFGTRRPHGSEDNFRTAVHRRALDLVQQQIKAAGWRCKAIAGRKTLDRPG